MINSPPFFVADLAAYFFFAAFFFLGAAFFAFFIGIFVRSPLSSFRSDLPAMGRQLTKKWGG